MTRTYPFEKRGHNEVSVESFRSQTNPGVSILRHCTALIPFTVSCQLKKLGFERIDAIDPCSAMLDIARDRGLYENYYEEFLSDAELPIPESKLQYVNT